MAYLNNAENANAAKNALNRGKATNKYLNKRAKHCYSAYIYTVYMISKKNLSDGLSIQAFLVIKM
jgi:hypothetical protein